MVHEADCGRKKAPAVLALAAVGQNVGRGVDINLRLDYNPQTLRHSTANSVQWSIAPLT